MYHLFFIHSSVDEHLHCFYVLATMNSAAMNIEVHISFSNYNLVQICALEWDCWIIQKFYFQFPEEPPYYFPQWLHQHIFPPEVQEDSLFSTSSPTFIICRLFDESHLTGVRWYLILSICISLIISNVEYLFIFLQATCILSFFTSYCLKIWLLNHIPPQRTLEKSKKNNLPRFHQQSLTFIYAILQSLSSSVSESVLTLSSCMVFLKYSSCLTVTKALS